MGGWVRDRLQHTKCIARICVRGAIASAKRPRRQEDSSAGAFDVDGTPASSDSGDRSVPAAHDAVAGSKAADRPERGESVGAMVLEVDGIAVVEAAMVLSQLRADAGAYLGSGLRARSSGCAGAGWKRATGRSSTQAAYMAGLEVKRLLPETVAACSWRRGDRQGGQHGCSVQPGGGTFGRVVRHSGEGIVEVGAVNGDALMGGADSTTG